MCVTHAHHAAFSCFGGNEQLRNNVKRRLQKKSTKMKSLKKKKKKLVKTKKRLYFQSKISSNVFLCLIISRFRRHPQHSQTCSSPKPGSAPLSLAQLPQAWLSSPLACWQTQTPRKPLYSTTGMLPRSPVRRPSWVRPQVPGQYRLTQSLPAQNLTF